ncbi:hypothetical protein ABPG72_002342 [Tetrahymena utriculariae]
MEGSKVEKEDIICIICHCIPTKAFTSQCCGIVGCDVCIQNMKQNKLLSCPNCRHKQPNFQLNMYLQKLINKFPVPCKYDCGLILQISEMPSHEIKCPQKYIECRLCEFKGSKEVFIDHATQTHEDQILKLLELNPYPQLSNQIDVLKEIKNSTGHTCNIGITSKFYCGKSAGFKCNICTGTCGPMNGCNCINCMELDIKYRKLDKGALVNGEGRIAFFKNGSFYCGLKTADSRLCGKEYTCRHCISLNGDINYYKRLIQ